MKTAASSRRHFLATLTASAGALSLAAPSAAHAAAKKVHLACNQYVWFIYWQREKKNLAENLDGALAEMAAVGIDGFEPTAGSAQEVERLGELVQKHNLEMRSLYVNSSLHDPARVDKSIGDILAVARAAKAVGTRILVTNPNPIQWGGQESKSDIQLECQAQAMNRLGEELGRLGLMLAYHNHDVELRQAAREFHHMMTGTDPKWVRLCLDAHWIYRGAGNSQVALLDVVRLYGRRVVELHVRQSRNQVWSETLEEGDVDYPRLVSALRELKVKPHLVLEQAVENGTPNTMTVVEAHRRTVEYARRVFAPLAG